MSRHECPSRSACLRPATGLGRRSCYADGIAAQHKSFGRTHVVRTMPHTKKPQVEIKRERGRFLSRNFNC